MALAAKRKALALARAAKRKALELARKIKAKALKFVNWIKRKFGGIKGIFEAFNVRIGDNCSMLVTESTVFPLFFSRKRFSEVGHTV